MGFVKDVKISTASSDAARAAAGGHNIFVFKFTLPTINYRATSSVSGAAEVIEAIEEQGWAMSQMSIQPRFRRGSMVMVFRRQ